jgi:glutamate-1-semialdehyde 2,1-aminomutase
VYQAGTLSGNPIATACGLETLREIQRPGFFENLSQRTQALCAGVVREAEQRRIDCCADSEGGMFGFFFFKDLPQNYARVMQTDGSGFNRFFHAMLNQGQYLAPALYEAGFVSAAHSAADIDATVMAAGAAFDSVLAG